MTTERTDLRYGRRGGGWVPDGYQPTGPGRPCEECGEPMHLGQRRRHYACSPRLECCGAYTDLVPDLAKHRADHLEADADPHRMRQRPDFDPGPRPD